MKVKIQKTKTIIPPSDHYKEVMGEWLNINIPKSLHDYLFEIYINGVTLQTPPPNIHALISLQNHTITYQRRQFNLRINFYTNQHEDESNYQTLFHTIA